MAAVEGKEGRRRCINPLYQTLVAGTLRISAPALALVVRMLALVRVQVEVQVPPQRVPHSKVVPKASPEVLKDSRVVLQASKVASMDYKAAPKDSKAVFRDLKVAFTVQVLVRIPSRPRCRCRGAAAGSILRTLVEPRLQLGLEPWPPLGTIESKIKRRPLLVKHSSSHRASHMVLMSSLPLLLAPVALALVPALPLLTGICRPSRMKRAVEPGQVYRMLAMDPDILHRAPPLPIILMPDGMPGPL